MDQPNPKNIIRLTRPLRLDNYVAKDTTFDHEHNEENLEKELIVNKIKLNKPLVKRIPDNPFRPLIQNHVQKKVVSVSLKEKTNLDDFETYFNEKINEKINQQDTSEICVTISKSSDKQCTNKSKIDGYCTIHYKSYLKEKWIERKISEGYRICSERSCINLLPSYDFKHKRCIEHLNKEKVKNEKRQIHRKEKASQNPDFETVDGTKMKYCVKCSQYKQETLFRGNKGNKTKHCDKCLEKDRKIHNDNCDRFSILEQKLFEYTRDRSKWEWKLHKDDKQNYRLFNNNPFAIYLFKQNCFYCDKNPTTNHYNGIDRINSNGNYEINNVVPACTGCNQMKCTHTLQRYRDIIEHIAAYNNIQEGKLNYELFAFKRTNCTYQTYKEDAFARNIPFKLTIKEYNSIIGIKCYICGLQPLNNEGGIDRLINNIGYLKENCKPCCTVCNELKKDLNYDDFLEMVRKNRLCINKDSKEVYQRYNELETVKGLINQQNSWETYPLFGSNKNELPLFNKFYLNRKLEEVSIIFKEDKELNNIYSFANFKYLCYLPDETYFSNNFRRIFIVDTNSDTFLGILTVNLKNNIPLVQVLPLGTLFTNEGIKVIYDIIGTKEFSVYLDEPSSIHILVNPLFNPPNLTVIKEHNHDYTFVEDLSQITNLYPNLDVHNAIINTFRSLNLKTNHLKLPIKIVEVNSEKSSILNIISGLIDKDFDSAKIDNLVLKGKYRVNIGMSGNTKNTCNPVRKINIKSDLKDNKKITDSFRDKIILKLDVKYKKINDFSRCQAHEYTEIGTKDGMCAGKNNLLGNKYCINHKKCLLRDYAKESGKILCKKLRYNECTVFLSSTELKDKRVNCSGCCAHILKNTKKYRDSEEYKESERIRQQEIRDNRTESEHTEYLAKRRDNRKSIAKSFSQKYDLNKIKNYQTTDDTLKRKLDKLILLVEQNPYINIKSLEKTIPIGRRKLEGVINQYKIC